MILVTSATGNIGPPVLFEGLSVEQAREHMGHLPEELVGDMLSTSGRDPGVLDTVREVTGVPARTFRQWARRNIAAFG
ncbi:hypothetical protein [Actinopolyspora mortivallis]|uniref:hypothetical protein n=1 Tax=Actinopolyspora mortivallis TaxID=33906 RepID=UPI00036F258E|nr:hypothetical protein [Actinopolyspora mortivallis]